MAPRDGDGELPRERAVGLALRLGLAARLVGDCDLLVPPVFSVGSVLRCVPGLLISLVERDVPRGSSNEHYTHFGCPECGYPC